MAPMVQMKVVYEGEKHCELTHGPSGVKISTDAPKDNNGRGEAFSPTDLCAVSLATCQLTVMAIGSEKDGIVLKGAWADVAKEMQANPRRIKSIKVHTHLPAALSAEWRERLERIAKTCPVRLSLHPEIQIDEAFIYDV